MSASTGALARLLQDARPGPWDALRIRGDDDPIVRGDGLVLARIAPGYQEQRMNREADARLIALAPEACRLLTDMASKLDDIRAVLHTIGIDAGQLEELLARFAALEEKAAQ